MVSGFFDIVEINPDTELALFYSQSIFIFSMVIARMLIIMTSS